MKFIFIFFLLVMSVYDFIWRRIPNYLTLIGFILGLIHGFLTAGATGLWNALFGALLTGLIGYIFWRAHMIGGGDHKLLIACGAFIGIHGVPAFLILTALFGGLEAVIWIATSAIRARSHKNLHELMHRTTIPYGLAIALGALVIVYSESLRFYIY